MTATVGCVTCTEFGFVCGYFVPETLLEWILVSLFSRPPGFKGGSKARLLHFICLCLQS